MSLLIWKQFIDSMCPDLVDSYLRGHLDYSGPEPLTDLISWYLEDNGLSACEVRIIGNEPLLSPPPEWTRWIGPYSEPITDICR